MTPWWTDEAWFNLFPVMAFEKVLRTDRTKVYPTRRGDMAALLAGKAGSYTGGWDATKFVMFTWLGIMEGAAPGDPQGGWVSRGARVTGSGCDGGSGRAGRRLQRISSPRLPAHNAAVCELKVGDPLRAA